MLIVNDPFRVGWVVTTIPRVAVLRTSTRGWWNEPFRLAIDEVKRGRSTAKLRMYILIRESIPAGFAVLAAAHASLAACLKFKDSAEVAEWLSGPFYKAVCRVTDAEFEKAKEAEDHVVLTESALDGAEVAMAFKPRAEYPKAFRFFKLFR